MSVTLRQPLSLQECQQVRLWRNAPDVLPMLRTGYKTEDEQAAFYRNVVCNPESPHRYYAIEVGEDFVGMGGLTQSTHFGGAEISLIISPHYRGHGLGTAAVDALIVKAQSLGFTAVHGECYAEGNLGFWAHQIQLRPARIEWRWNLTSEGYGHGV